jgi:hypothetical protein
MGGQQAPRRWRMRPQAAIGGGVALLVLAGVIAGVVDDVGSHRALGSAESSLVSTRRDLIAASAAARSLSAQLGVLGLAQASMRAQDALLASENASLAAELSAAASAQAAHAGAPIFQRSGSGGIPEPAAIGVVVASQGRTSFDTRLPGARTIRHSPLPSWPARRTSSCTLHQTPAGTSSVRTMSTWRQATGGSGAVVSWRAQVPLTHTANGRSP